MQNLPNELINGIFADLTDIDFIYYMATDKYFNNLDKSNLKVFTGKYKLSKIIDKHYIFTNIIYDLPVWDLNHIPKNIISIEFMDQFNEDIGELFKFKNIKSIKLGMFYTNPTLMESDLEAVNETDLTRQFILNKIFAFRMEKDIAKLHSITSNKDFPGWFNKISICLIQRKQFRMWGGDPLDYIKNNERDAKSFVRTYDGYNNSINKGNKYEKKFYLDTDTPHPIIVENITDWHIDFHEFIFNSMIINLKKLQDMVYTKYNCAQLDDFLKLLWGEEAFAQSKLRAAERREQKKQHREDREKRNKIHTFL